MQDRYYPVLDVSTIQALETVQLLIEDDPTYLDEAPYPKEVLEYLRGGGGEERPVVPVEDLDLEAEADRLYQELREYGETVKDPAERNTYFRLSTTLMEKLLNIKERATNVAMVKQFTETVLQIMEDELSPDQRTSIMRRLRDLMGEE